MNLVILHSDVPKKDKFIEALQPNNKVTSDIELLNNFNDIVDVYDRVAFVWKFRGKVIPPFLKFVENDEKEIFKIGDFFGYHFTNFILSLKEKNPNIVVDLISCNLNKPKFIEFVEKFSINNNIKINYSLNKTGNPHLGGDWIMENSGTNIKDIYFNEKITEFDVVLDANVLTVTGATTNELEITQAYLNANMNTGVTFTGNTITFTEDIDWVTTDWYIYVNNSGSNQVTIEGGEYTVTLPGGSFSGLILLEDEADVIIQNFSLTNGTISDGNGGLVGSMLGIADTVVLVKNCSHNYNLGGDRSGGLFGDYFCGNGGLGKVINCHCNGTLITANDAGGIFGQNAGYNGKVIAYNCTSSANCSGARSGGIIGRYGFYQGVGYVIKCSTSNAVSGSAAGGLIGYNCALYGYAYVFNCYCTGVVSGTYCGGMIGGSYCDTTGYIYVGNCYCTGTISGTYAGGIVGGGVTYTGALMDLQIYGCYSTGNITGTYAGGILGGNVLNSNSNDHIAKIVHCFSQGAISGQGSGGIIGGLTKATAYGCYSTGNITGLLSGGIAGYTSKSSIYGCYANGSIDNSESLIGGIAGDNQILEISENSYSNASTYTNINDNTSPYDGSNNGTLLSTTLPASYGFIAGDDAPHLKVFTQYPWTSYEAYDDVPSLNSNDIGFSTDNLTVLDIKEMFTNIWDTLSDYAVKAISPIKQNFVTRPYRCIWSMEVIDIDGGDSSSTRQALSDISSGNKTTIVSEFDTFYQDQVDDQVTFALSQGSILATMTDVSCFGEDTLFETPNGLVKIKDLKVGDIIKTGQGTFTTIKKIGQFKKSDNAFVLKRHSIAHNVPFEDLIISRNHKIKINEKWIYPYEVCENVTIKEQYFYHIRTVNDSDTLLANGIVSEVWKKHKKRK